jgi:6,7-dimethyl-8-ribityllumazine synthase
MATANKNLSNYDKNTVPNAKDFRFGIVVSEWNDHITEGLYNGALVAAGLWSATHDCYPKC